MVLHYHSPLSVESAYSGGGDTLMSVVTMEQMNPPTPMSQPLPYVENFDMGFPLPLNHAMGNSQGYEDGLDLDSIEMLLNSEPLSDLGPPPMPVRLPRLDEEPPRSKEYALSAYAPPPNHYLSDRSASNPNSPSSELRRSRTMYASDSLPVRGPRSRNRTSKSPRSGFKRATSPMFPDHSVPISSVSRHSSNASLSSIKSDPFGTISSRLSGISDPALYRDATDSNVNSPALSAHGDPNSPRFIFGHTQGPTDSSHKSNMELEMPLKYARKIFDVDRRILKLQAERSKLLEKAQQQMNSDISRGIEEIRWPTTEKIPETVKVHLYVFPIGIDALDEPVYEEASSVLRSIGGMYSELQSAISNLRNICCKGMLFLPDISTCFAYINSLLHEHQRLKLAGSINGVYRVHFDVNDGNDMVPQEFLYALSAANDVLKSAQHITLAYPHIQIKLQNVQGMAIDKVVNCENICNKLGILDRERRTQIRSVLEGNTTAVASAMIVWPQYYKLATETIRAITECIHPTS